MRRLSASRWVMAAVLAVTMAAEAGAQSVPNLSGTWNLDPAKSDAAPAPGGGRGRGNQNQMVITQTATEIAIVMGGANYIYNLDGSERTGPPGGETKSRISWDAGKLVVTWNREYFAGPDKGYVTSNGRDIYTLNGDVLTVERTTSAPSARTRKSVYNKAP